MAKPFIMSIPKLELSLENTFQSGQTFRWMNVSPNSWRGTIGDTLFTLKQDGSNMHCTVMNAASITPKCENLDAYFRSQLNEYFKLNHSLPKLYEHWSNCDKNFAQVSKNLPGLRLLSQEPVENVFSFICSSNNNINRITSLVGRLCENFGYVLAEVNGTIWYSFPSIDSLASDCAEAKLKKLGFGYRAKYINQAALEINRYGGREWLYSLRSMSYEDCHDALRKLAGIGPKVADCICLMSMGHLKTIPVDTHVFQVAARDYLPHLQSKKSVTPKIYHQIVQHFQSLFGDKAGWAHSVLFCADLKKFKRKTITSQGPPPKLCKK